MGSDRMDYSLTICQKIMRALLPPHRRLTVSQLIEETGVAGYALLPVLNRMIGSGHVVVTGNRVSRKTFLKAVGF